MPNVAVSARRRGGNQAVEQSGFLQDEPSSGLSPEIERDGKQAKRNAEDCTQTGNQARAAMMLARHPRTEHEGQRPDAPSMPRRRDDQRPYGQGDLTT